MKKPLPLQNKIKQDRTMNNLLTQLPTALDKKITIKIDLENLKEL